MDTYRILVTGWRDWPEDCAPYIEEILHTEIMRNVRQGRVVTVVVGDCPTGGDLFATRLVNASPYRQFRPARLNEAEVWHADWGLYGSTAGPIRNQKMVDTGVDVCLAFPGVKRRQRLSGEPLDRSVLSGGTHDCLTRAAVAGVETRIYPFNEGVRRQVEAWRAEGVIS